VDVTATNHLKHPRRLPAGPENAQQQDDKPCPNRVRPQLQAALAGVGFGESGDGGDDFGGGGRSKELAAGELGDFLEDIMAGRLAALFQRRALDGNFDFERGAAFGAGEAEAMRAGFARGENAGEQAPGFFGSTPRRLLG